MTAAHLSTFAPTTYQNSLPVTFAAGSKGSAVKALYIEPGSTWENGYCEGFNSKLRDEVLAGELFSTPYEAQVLIVRWRKQGRHPLPLCVAFRRQNNHSHFTLACLAGCNRSMSTPLSSDRGRYCTFVTVAS